MIDFSADDMTSKFLIRVCIPLHVSEVRMRNERIKTTMLYSVIHDFKSAFVIDNL